MIAVSAPAKVNAYLHVGSARPNGRHALESLVLFADHTACDRVTVTPATDLSLEITGAGAEHVEAGESNLVMRAARALRAAGAVEGGAVITLDKQLPLAAGIGGGSADAGAALRALTELWGLAPGLAETIAPALGGDVPACLRSAPCLMRGEGEVIAPVELIGGLPAVLANPGVACRTAAVFEAFDANGGGANFREQELPEFPVGDDGRVALINWLAVQENDLQAAAIGLVPEIDDVLEVLEDLPGAIFARMSGSGATCFALFETMEAAKLGAEALAALRPSWWLRATELGAGA